ncbi:mitochondrial/chloroplast ribosomal protein L54/L37 [Epithele typhae]|uniref:mitochondrial/chloroplast ribosomal protein L54/L37 n=1 Tax=Epithele typhae TaxID=378194 RepID=UPI00200779CC|nr:mitochondrial/chloroplast ribosomal protein L54/L37 [Epithele typhae]KAH9928555.1 mitochondrial/chloroplast ribosomal protein L54/L37 [Epithele typhae]
MSFSLVPAALRRQAQIAALWAPRRCLSSASHPRGGEAEEGEQVFRTPRRSSAPENTVLAGLAYLKSQPELVDDGPGGKAEKARMRKENRERIRVSNFMKTQ